MANADRRRRRRVTAMKMPEWLRQALRRRPRPADPRKGLQNPYHRCFTQDRTFEELARAAREKQKNPPKEP